MKAAVTGASMIRCGSLGYRVRSCGYKASGAQVFRARQLAAWREATGRKEPGAVALAINGREFASEAEARKFLRGEEVIA